MSGKTILLQVDERGGVGGVGQRANFLDTIAELLKRIERTPQQAPMPYGQLG